MAFCVGISILEHNILINIPWVEFSFCFFDQVEGGAGEGGAEGEYYQSGFSTHQLSELSSTQVNFPALRSACDSSLIGHVL